MKSLLSATCGTASRFSSTWIRIPVRSEWSARSEISVSDLVLDELGDLADDAVVAALLDAVRKLGDDDRGLAAAQLLDVRARAHDDAAAAGAVRVADPAAADDERAGREVGALDVLHQALDVDLRVVDHRDDGVDRLAEMVRRHVRRHPHGDAGRSR